MAGASADDEPAVILVNDQISLRERFGALEAVRIGMVILTLAVAAVAPRTVGASITELGAVSTWYAVATAAAEWLRRRLGARATGLVNGLLLVDGLWVALILIRTGGSGSVLHFLVYVHVVAVTLLLSSRTGLKVALWHGLLVGVTYYGQLSGWVDPNSPLAILRADPTLDDAFVFRAAALCIVALATAGFSSLNERELRRREADLQELATMAAELRIVRSPDQIVDVLVEHVTGCLGFARALVAPPFVTDEVVGRCWEQRAPLLLREVDGAKNPWLAEMLPRASNVVVVPMVAEDCPVGSLVIERGGRTRTRIPRRTIQMVQQFADHAALALRSAALLSEVERLARVDALTGLPNRRAFEENLQRELHRSKRTGTPCSLIILDVDHFKTVNDRHGHQAGDTVLEVVGSTLAELSRGMDLAARYGGEEFVVLLPLCLPRGAMAIAERLRGAIAASATPVQITVSAGVAAFPVNATEGSDLVAAADEALYQSKREGRDRSTASARTVPVTVTSSSSGRKPLPESHARVPAPPTLDGL